jgi:hypothetical protein
MIDIERIQNKQIGKIYKPLYVSEYSTVRQILIKEEIKQDSELIVFQIDSAYLAFPKLLMAFHHIAEGYIKEKPYMLTFCVICNTGMIMNPVVHNEMLHFYVAGVYNGMLLMADTETGSYWDHITGKGLYGKYENYQLEILQSHQVLTTKEVLEQYPDCLYGLTKLNFFQKLFSKFQHWKANTGGTGFLPPGFRKSMLTIDNRLPEMEMGLGVWIDSKARFYPIKLIKQNGNYLFDTFHNRALLIYISPTTFIPIAMYLDEITSVTFEGKKLSFQNGDYVLGGNLYSSHNEKLGVSAPNHIFSRWYGFVSTFPNCEIKNEK